MKFTSRIKVLVDGEELLNKTGWTFNPGGVNRNTESGDYHTGYTEELVHSSIAGTVSHTEKMDLVEIGKVNNATILVELNSGQEYVMRGAWLINPAELNTSEGGASLEFNAPPAERM